MAVVQQWKSHLIIVTRHSSCVIAGRLDWLMERDAGLWQPKVELVSTISAAVSCFSVLEGPR